MKVIVVGGEEIRMDHVFGRTYVPNSKISIVQGRIYRIKSMMHEITEKNSLYIWQNDRLFEMILNDSGFYTAYGSRRIG